MARTRKDLPEVAGRAKVVTYARVPSLRRTSEPEIEAESVAPAAGARLNASEVPFVEVHPSDAIGIAPEPEAMLADDAVVDLVAPRQARRPVFAIIVGIGVIAMAAGIGVLVSTYNRTTVATALAPASDDKAAEILSLRQQIEAVARDAAKSAEDARQKTADLQQRLAEIEEGTPATGTDTSADATDAQPVLRDVTSAPATSTADLTTDNGAAADLAPAPVAAIPPVPRPRPDPSQIAAPLPTPAATPAPTVASLPAAPSGTLPSPPLVLGAPPAPLAAPPSATLLPADDSSYVQSIERILADAPPDQARPAARIAADPGTSEDGPIPPEPIPNVQPDQGGVQ